jgi:hypothetical protein
VAPHLQRLKTYLDEIVGRYIDKGAMRTAIGYALNNWHKFTAFLTELFERYPLAINDEQRSELLPWNFKFSA